MSSKPIHTFDLCIAGSGLSALLFLRHLKIKNPTLRVAVIERSPSAKEFLHLSDSLYHFVDQTVRLDPEENFSIDLSQDQKKLGILNGKECDEVLLQDFGTKLFAKKFGGLAAAREWEDFISKIQNAENTHQTIDDLDPKFRKGAVGSVLEPTAGIFGITDLWKTSVDAFRQRFFSLNSLHTIAQRKDLIDLLTREQKDVTFFFDHLIGSAHYENNHWLISTQHAIFECDQLVVAQSPWTALQWLDKNLVPTPILNLASKVKPVTTVIHTYKIPRVLEDYPAVVFVPSEEVHIHYAGDKSISFQKTLDFEFSLQAPNVLKAIKSLRRAMKKWTATFDLPLTTTDEKISLVPAGWHSSGNAHDARFLEKLEEKNIQQQHLIFVGDSYGPSYSWDENTILSIHSGLESLLVTK